MIKNTANLKETKNLNPELVNTIMNAGASAGVDGGLARLNRALKDNTHHLNDYYLEREAYSEATQIVETDQLGIIHLVTACSSDDIFHYVAQIPGIDLTLNYVYTKERRADFSDTFRISPARPVEKVEILLSPAEYAIALGRYDRAATLFAYGSSIDLNVVKRIIRSDVTVARVRDLVRAQLPGNDEIRRIFDWKMRNPTPPSSPPSSIPAPL